MSGYKYVVAVGVGNIDGYVIETLLEKQEPRSISSITLIQPSVCYHFTIYLIDCSMFVLIYTGRWTRRPHSERSQNHHHRLYAPCLTRISVTRDGIRHLHYQCPDSPCLRSPRSQRQSSWCLALRPFWLLNSAVAQGTRSIHSSLLRRLWNVNWRTSSTLHAPRFNQVLFSLAHLIYLEL